LARLRQANVLACHNYRWKQNVRRMLGTIERYNPGRLRHVTVRFQSPPVSNDSAGWLRDERKVRTLLMDYSLHFLDLACMFGAGEWAIGQVRHELNSQVQTQTIEGNLRANYSVHFFLAQGFSPRR